MRAFESVDQNHGEAIRSDKRDGRVDEIAEAPMRCDGQIKLKTGYGQAQQ